MRSNTAPKYSNRKIYLQSVLNFIFALSFALLNGVNGNKAEANPLRTFCAIDRWFNVMNIINPWIGIMNDLRLVVVIICFGGILFGFWLFLLLSFVLGIGVVRLVLTSSRSLARATHNDVPKNAQKQTRALFLFYLFFSFACHTIENTLVALFSREAKTID